MGYVLHDRQGCLIQVGIGFMYQAFILVFEAIAMCDGIHVALHAGLSHFQIEGYNRLII